MFSVNRPSAGSACPPGRGFGIVFVSNGALLPDGESYERRLERLASAGPDAIILREKALGADEYAALAGTAAGICAKYGVPLILHGHTETASALRSPRLHLPLDALRRLGADEARRFAVLGASCHSVEDAVEAERLGCTYITAGHIYDTDCKKGLPGRGTEFLRRVCSAVGIPVLAIGGISRGSIRETALAGAAGVCVMSGAMRCPEPEEYLRTLRECV